MTTLAICASCGGFIPRAASTCPHCNATTPRPLFERLRIGALGGAFGGGAIALTLMACYGAPPCDDGTRDCYDNNDAGDAGRDADLPDVQVGDKDAAADAPSDAHDDGGGDGG